MEHILGVGALLAVAIVIIVLALRHPQLRNVLLLAFAVRAGAALFHFYIAPLPDGTADALYFERMAWTWAQEGIPAVWSDTVVRMNLLNSWIIAVPYSFFGRSQLMAQALSVLAGMGGVYLVWRLARDLWGERAAIKAAWVAAFFPSLVLYSALTMREAYWVLFFLVGLLGVVQWARQGGLLPTMLALSGLILAGLLHGAMFIAVFVFLALIAVRSIRAIITSLGHLRLPIPALLVLLMLSLGGVWLIQSEYRVPKLGSVNSMLNFEGHFNRITGRFHKGTAGYPDLLVPQTVPELIWKAPLRAGYFLFSPLPWDIQFPRHLIGQADAMLYLALAMLAWSNRKAIWADPGSRAMLIIVVSLIAIYGFAVANFGTGLRHRAKLAAALIILAAPLLPMLKTSAKNSLPQKEDYA